MAPFHCKGFFVLKVLWLLLILCHANHVTFLNILYFPLIFVFSYLPLLIHIIYLFLAELHFPTKVR